MNQENASKTKEEEECKEFLLSLLMVLDRDTPEGFTANEIRQIRNIRNSTDVLAEQLEARGAL